MPKESQAGDCDQLALSGCNAACCVQAEELVHVSVVEGSALYMPTSLPGIGRNPGKRLFPEAACGAFKVAIDAHAEEIA
jgi:hypothetical protein